MRGIALGLVFFPLLPLIFIRGPFVGILMWFWVSLMYPQFVVYGFFADIPYALIVAVATLLSWLLFLREPKLPPPDKTSVLLVLLMIWASITSYFGTGPPSDIYQSWLLTEKMLLMTVVAHALTNNRERLDQLITVCVLSVTFWGLKGGVWTLRHGGQYLVLGPATSMIGDNNELGVALTMMLPLLFYLLRRYPQPYFKWPMWGLIGLTLLGDLFTYSRGALLAIGAMAVVVWFRSRHKVLSATFALVVAGAVWNFAPAQWLGRMDTIKTYQQDNSAEQRLYLWRLAWAMTLRHPILGSGFNWSYAPASVNEQLAGQGFHWHFGGDAPIPKELSGGELPPLIMPRAAHSIWFEMMSDHGFPGLFLLVAILVSAMLDARWLVRMTRRRPDLAWADGLGRTLQASLVAFAVGGTFVSLPYYDGFYAMVIIAAAARRVVAEDLAEATAPALPPSTSAASPRLPLHPRPAG
jgi:putative inorganic carbon (hco3(-)) transporter